MLERMKSLVTSFITIHVITIIMTVVTRKVMLDGVGEEENLVATGGAADHLAVLYKTDDQVMMIVMMMMMMMMMMTMNQMMKGRRK